jgi:hypothetical protein
MTRYANRADVAAKIEWEGGIWETLEYGLAYTDMPEGDDALASAWAALQAAFGQARHLAREVEKLLPEPGEPS